MTVHGDFSRDVTGRWAGVLYQQGRVLMDADGNAQTAITTGWQDTAARDVIGADVAAAPADQPDSFRIDAAHLSGDNVTLEVQPGHVWVDGMLVYTDVDELHKRTATWLQPPLQDPPGAAATVAAGVRDAVVLEVWREATNAFQLPGDLIEPALGGVDTTERLNTAKAFRLYRMAAGDTCESIRDRLRDDPATLGKLTVTLEPDVTIPGDCPVVEGGGYSGFEHSLARIEIAESDSATPRFKYSFFNGGLVGRAVFDAGTMRAAISANLAAIASSNLAAFYLEAIAFDGDAGYWKVVYGAEVTLVEDSFVLPAAPETGTIPGGGDAVFIRLWNGITDVAAFPPGANPNALIDGIELGFDAPGPAAWYRPGDSWTFTVRAGDVAQTGILPTNAPPEGIHYHRVPLAVLEWDGSNDLAREQGTIEDCRRIIHPLTRLGTCCTFSVGDGVHSHGDFTSIQEAVNQLPAEGGQVCVLPGTYTENVRIFNRQHVTISGCDARCLVISGEAREDQAGRPVFHVVNSPSVEIRGLAIRAHREGIGILLEDTVHEIRGRGRDVGPSGLLSDQRLHDLYVRAFSRPAIEVRGGIDISIRECLIEMFDAQSGWPAIFFQGEDGLIERNVIRVRPSETEDVPDDVIRSREYLDRARQPIGVLSEGEPIVARSNLGGIQLGGLSERVRVVNNVIQGGIGNGITLGSVRVVNVDGQDTGVRLGWVINLRDPCNPCKPGDVVIGDPDPNGPDGGIRFVLAGPLRDIVIEDNRILDMGLSGIGVIGYFNLLTIGNSRSRRNIVTVERLRIEDNEIRRCLWRDLAPVGEQFVDQAGYGGISLASVQQLHIARNIIEDNGPNYLEPVCGIFILLGVEIEISHNRIVNNGATTEEPPYNARPGRRGGINIVIAAAPDIEDLEHGGFNLQGRAAVRIHDNVVSVPLGQALSVNAYGPVSVHGNTFSSKGVVPRPAQETRTLYGTTVMINCLSTAAEESIGQQGFNSIATGVWTKASHFQAAANTEATWLGGQSSINMLANLRPPQSGFVEFSNNQCQLVPLPLRRVIEAAPVDTTTVPSSGGLSGFVTTISSHLLALKSTIKPSAAASVIGPSVSGANLFIAAGLRMASVSIYSLDDIAVTDNQCLTALPEGALLTHLFAYGFSVRVLGNRFKEGPGDAAFSAATLGGMNITSDNQGSHCFLVRPQAPSDYSVDGPNQLTPLIFTPGFCRRYTGILAAFGKK